MPGIRDDQDKIQGIAVRCWRIWGVQGQLHEMPWAGPEAYAPKLARLLAVIDMWRAKGYQVSLVGASAGATAVLDAYLQRKDDITSVIFVCGKLNRPYSASAGVYQTNPAFQAALEGIQSPLTHLAVSDTAKMTSFYSPADKTVPHSDSIISGVKEVKLPAISHAMAIIYSVTVGSRRIVRSAK